MRKIVECSWQRIVSFVILCCFSFATFAQDKGLKIDVDINKHDEWYRQPWVWIVGGAVFILLLVALLRGGGSRKAA